LITKTIVNHREDALRWTQLLQPLGWLPEFRGWMALPESIENMTGRDIQAPKGVCVFMAEPEAFNAHPWFGEVRLLYVDTDGLVVPCCIHPHAGVLGNLKIQRYSEILAGQARADFKAQMANDRPSMKVCGGCEMGPAGDEGPSFWNSMAPPEQTW